MHKHIAFVSDAIYPYNKGGKEKRLFEITTRLAKEGYYVTIYCMKWWQGTDERIEHGVRLKAISPLYPLYSGKRRSFRQAIFFMLHCIKLIREKFDILDVDHMPHLVLFSTKIVALIKRKPMVATWHEVWGRDYWRKYVGSLGDICYLIELISSKLPDRIVAVSKHTQNLLLTELKVKQPTIVVSNGIDTKLFNDIKPRSDRHYDLIFAGRLLSHKNIDLVIDVVEKLKSSLTQITCLIIGQGPERESLEKLVSQKNLENNVSFIDFVESDKELYGLFKSSKIFVFPSSREGFGVVALEANASYLPVITIEDSNNATKDLIIDGVNGFVVQKQSDDIADVIYSLLSDSDKLNRIKTTSFNTSITYDWDNLVKNYNNVYQI